MIKESFEYNSDIVNDLSSPGKPEDVSFMREAIRLSQLAVEHGKSLWSGSGKKWKNCIYELKIRFIQDMIRPFMEKLD